MNRFEQVSSDGHPMSLVELGLETGPMGVPCVWREGGPHVRGVVQ